MSKIKLMEKLIDGRVVEYPLDNLNMVEAREGATYSVIDESTGELPEGLVLRREGDMLVIDVEEETVAKIDDYYNDEGAGFTVPDGSEAGEAVLAGGEAADVADGAIVWPAGSESAGISPWVWAGGAAVLAGGAAVAIADSDDDDDAGTVADTTAPTLDGELSTSGATDVAAGADITIVFDEDIALGDSGTITLVNDDTGETITIDVADHGGQLSVSGNTLTIDPTDDLAEGCCYHIEISSGALEDLAGNDYGGIDDAAGFAFETAAPADTTAPTLVPGSCSPLDDAGGVAVDSDITLTFSEDIALGTSGTITLVSDTDPSDTRTIDVAHHNDQISVSGDTLSINPDSDLADGSSYHVEISSGAIEDLAGNDFAGIDDSTTLNFETEPGAAPSLNVVFDLVEGVSSNHSSRTFEADTTYTIYIRIDSVTGELSMDGSSSLNPGATWGTWSGASNLGADDTIIFVGNDANGIKGKFGSYVTRFHKSPYSFKLWTSNTTNTYSYGAHAVHISSYGLVACPYRTTTTIGSYAITIWTGIWKTNPNTDVTSLTQCILKTMPAGIMTSQGLA